MKVKLTETIHGPRVVFWCAGCGAFHQTDPKNWNGSLDDPTITGGPEGTAGTKEGTWLSGPPEWNDEMKARGVPFCAYRIQDGKIFWAHASTHDRAGGEMFMPHEETWRGVTEDWSKNPKETK